MLFNKISQPFAEIRPWTFTGSDQILSFNWHHILCNVWKSNLWPPPFFSLSLPTNEWFNLQENPTLDRRKCLEIAIRSEVSPILFLNSLHRILIYFFVLSPQSDDKKKVFFLIIYCAERK